MVLKGFARNEEAIQREGARLTQEAEKAEGRGVVPYSCVKGKTTLRVLPPFSEGVILIPSKSTLSGPGIFNISSIVGYRSMLEMKSLQLVICKICKVDS